MLTPFVTQAKRGGSKGSFKEWRKLRPFLLERIGIGVAGVELDEKLRALYAEMDVDNTVGSEGIDAGNGVKILNLHLYRTMLTISNGR